MTKFEKLPTDIEENYLPPNYEEDDYFVEDKFLKELPNDIMKEKSITMLETLDSMFDIIKGLKIDVHEGDLDTTTSAKIKRRYKKIIEYHYNSIKIMLDTGKISIDEVVTFLGKDKQKRIKDLFEFGIDEFLVNNNLN